MTCPSATTDPGFGPQPHCQPGRRGAALAVVLATGSLAAGCAPGAPSLLRPSGPGALSIERFWWVLFGASAAVVGFLLALMAVSILRRHRPAGADPDGNEPGWGDRFIVVPGVGVSGARLHAVFTLSLHAIAAL